MRDRVRLHKGMQPAVSLSRGAGPRETDPESKVTTKTHSRRRDPTVAVWMLLQEIDGHFGIFIVRREQLLDFVRVAGVGPWRVVGEDGRWPLLELVKDGRTRDNVALTGDRVGESTDRSGDVVLRVGHPRGELAIIVGERQEKGATRHAAYNL